MRKVKNQCYRPERRGGVEREVMWFPAAGSFPNLLMLYPERGAARPNHGRIYLSEILRIEIATFA